MALRIEALLAARLFLAPQHEGDRVYFVSNLGGHLSLYAMDRDGSVPELLLPPNIALQNPELLDGYAFYVFPDQGEIIVMIDHDGDEQYQPMRIPLDGGFPEPALPQLADHRLHLIDVDLDTDLIYYVAESNKEPVMRLYRVHRFTGALELVAESTWGVFPVAPSSDGTKAVVGEGYTSGDITLYLWEQGKEGRHVLLGTPLEDRAEGQDVPLTGIMAAQMTASDQGVLLVHALFEETYGFGYLDLANPSALEPVTLSGAVHTGVGELVGLKRMDGDTYYVTFNIDGASWLYRGRFDEASRHMTLETVIVGQGELADGVLEGVHYEKATDSFSLAFSTATSPTQIYIVADGTATALTRERVLGIPREHLSTGEDASFISHDGLRVSARLYLPAPALGFDGPRPLVYYVHGGPQSQERPNFAWFSMPLIQFLTLNGFAVFVPNARGSSGYGLPYMKRVDRDWGGQDRLDHVHAMKLLGDDPRVDASRAGVVGRSYGGYMTLTLAARHPELWSAAVDMFGPYDLTSFMDRIPETWKPYFAIAVGDPVTERDFLFERSPRTYFDGITMPLLVIQGKNDPRVVEAESRDVVNALRDQGKQVDYLMFENEGHDVLKFENRVTCYNAITDFFKTHL